jgi:quinol monooxygenase YgiN
MSKVYIFFKMKLNLGQEQDFKSYVRQLEQLVKEKCPRTLGYEWFLNEDETQCLAVETFVDSDALMFHADTVNDLAMKLFSTCEIQEVNLLGDPSEAVIARTSAYGAKVHRLIV